MRVHEIAKELGYTSKEILQELHDLGFTEVKNVLAVLTDEQVAHARFLCGEGPEPDTLPPKDRVKEPASEPEPQEAEAEEPAPEEEAPATEDTDEPVETLEEPAPAPLPEPEKPAEPETPESVLLKGPVTVRDFAEMLGVKPNVIVADLMGMNVFASINEKIEVKMAQKLGSKRGVKVELEKKKQEAKPAPPPIVEAPPPKVDKPDELKTRPPIVTMMGHVDHGKTSLLDWIRKTRVTAKESGGITQHIGAYTADFQGRPMTFLDTPGHAAFTAMRARGANLTDIVVIVIAADDGIMPQTKEAIQHARAANVAIMVAINKVDLPQANVDRVKQQLQQIDLAPEDWGGQTICCPVSATAGDGMEHLLEMIALQAEVLELQANPERPGEGFVIESQLEPGMGPTANLLVRHGTLKVGQTFLCGPYAGKVKALINDAGKKVKSAGPSIPVKCLGLPDVPEAGAPFRVIADAREAKGISDRMLAESRVRDLQSPQRQVTLDDLLRQTDPDSTVELPLIIKTDVQGSAEALQHALGEIKSDKVKISFVLCGVGNITANDVLLASASKAIIIGFHVSKENGVNALAKREGVEIRLYSIIYQLIDEMRDAMRGMLQPESKETVLGQAEILQIFDLGKKSRVAGCVVKSGRITANAKARVLRGGEPIFAGQLGSLKRFQNDAKEVREGQECGMRLDGFSDYEAGDIIEAYAVEKIAAQL